MKNLFLILFIGLLGTGCGNLRPDPVLPAIEAKYPTAEMYGCGQAWHGHGLCPVVRGKNYSDINFEVQVYHSGTLTVDSKDCAISMPISYNGTQTIPVHIPGVVDRTCVVTVTVSPKYPTEEKQNIRVYSFRGHMVFRMLEHEDDEWVGLSAKVTEGFSHKVKLWIGGSERSVQMVADGCDRDTPYNKMHTVVNGWLEFDLNQILPEGMQLKTCVIEGYVRSGFPDLLYNIVVSKYDPRFVKLPIPAVSVDGKKLLVSANKAVSIISLNDEFELDYETTFNDFNFNQCDNIVLRLLTVGGRSAIGRCNKTEKVWSWMH